MKWSQTKENCCEVKKWAPVLQDHIDGTPPSLFWHVCWAMKRLSRIFMLCSRPLVLIVSSFHWQCHINHFNNIELGVLPSFYQRCWEADDMCSDGINWQITLNSLNNLKTLDQEYMCECLLNKNEWSFVQQYPCSYQFRMIIIINTVIIIFQAHIVSIFTADMVVHVCTNDFFVVFCYTSRKSHYV